MLKPVCFLISRYISNAILPAIVLVFLCGGCDDKAGTEKKPDAFIESSRQWDPLFDTEKTVKLTLSSQRWFPLGQGCEFYVNGESFILHRDLASLLIDVEVENLTGEPLPFYPDFRMEQLGSDGRVMVSIGEDQPVDHTLTIPPNETVTLTLQTTHLGLDDYVQEPELLLTGYHNTNTWGWPLESIPGHDVLFGKFYSCIHRMQVEITEQHWSGIAAGSSAQTLDGEGATISDDLAGLELTVKAVNPTEYPLNITEFPVLVASEGGVSGEFFPAISQEDGSIVDVVAIEPGETKIFKLQMNVKAYEEMHSSQPFTIQWNDFKLNMPVVAIPAKTQIYAK